MSEELQIMPPQVPVEVNDRVVGDKDAIEALRKQLDMVPLNESAIRDCEALGIHIRGVGVLKYQRGRTMVNHQRLSLHMSQVSRLIGQIVDDPKMKLAQKVDKVSRLVTAQAELSRRDVEAGRFMVDIERSVAPAGAPMEEPMPEQSSFLPGQPVRRGGTTVNVQQMNIHKG